MIFNENGEIMTLNEGLFDKKVSEEVKQIFKDTTVEANGVINQFMKGDTTNSSDGEKTTKKYQSVMLNGFNKMVSACQGKDDYKYVIKKVQREKGLEERGKRPSKEYINSLIKIANGCRFSI